MTAYLGKRILEGGTLEQPVHLAIGMFDGVHVGHQAVIHEAIKASQAQPGSLSGVLTFDPHPSQVLRPDQATALLMPLEQRVERMLEVGIDKVFVFPFTREFAAGEASEFVPTLRSWFPMLKSLYVGENFRFGAMRSGNVDTLTETAGPLDIRVGVLRRKSYQGEPISSSAIRASLAQGEMSAVNSMLGSPYRISGTIIAGKKVGRGLGFPTVNISWNPEALPRLGVYRVEASDMASGDKFCGIANYGLHPTVSEAASPLLEVHFLDGSEFPTTGDKLEVSLLEFIRPEMKFSSMEALQEQIRRDVEAVKAKDADTNPG
nr:riboflavin biosynthesis protein RibF [Oceanipulchritudo coccoides]